MNFNITPVVKALLLINLLVFVADAFIFSFTPLFGLRYILSPNFHGFQFVTYMFLHANFSHVFFNMFALFMFGPLLESFWGSKKFMIFYFVTGIGAGVVYSLITFYQMWDLQQAITAYIANPNPDSFTIFFNKYAGGSFNVNYRFINAFAENPESQDYIKESVIFVTDLFNAKSNVPMIGASGAVFGILMAYGMTFPNSEMYLFPIPIPIKAWVYVTFYGIIELYQGVKAAENDNVAHFAHLGGMIFAFIMIRLWRDKSQNDYY